MRRAALALLATALAGCAGEAAPPPAVEVLARAPLILAVEADGEVRAVKSTPLLVPGAPWSQQRQLEWMKAEGARVGKGEVVARFSPAQSALELAKAELDLERNGLARDGKDSELDAGARRVEVDLAQVGTDLAIARRYARVELAMFARHQILDAVQDEAYLGVRQDWLEWRRLQGDGRGAAERAVLDAQRQTFDLAARNRRADLEALEIKAPHAGVLVLSADWSGEKPKVGATLWAGEDFGSLPELDALEAQLWLPELHAQGVTAGATVELHPLGRPERTATATVGSVAGSAQPRSRDSPVKYLLVKVPLPAEAVRSLVLVPGQSIRARVVTARRDAALSVPQVAIRSAGGRRFVDVMDGATRTRREVTLGARGPGRAEVVSGLNEGDVVALAPADAAASAP